MSDFITNFRWAIRGILSEGVQPHDVIIMAVLPGESEGDTSLRVIGFDKAMARKAAKFGTGVSGGKGEELGKWDYVGLPERSVTGRAEAPPWVMFMDWLWDFLKKVGLDPQPAAGFGGEAGPGEKLSVHAKRAKKYGVGISIPMAPRDVVPPGFEGAWSKIKGAWTGTPGKEPGEKRFYKEKGMIPGPGYDINRDVTIIINSLGDTQEERAKKFDQILKGAQTPDWFKIVSDIDKKGEHNYRWFVRVNIDVTEPEGWRERLSGVEAYKRENREKWKTVINNLAGGQTHPVQLVPLVIAYLVEKHDFERPFHIDMLEENQFNKAIDIVKNLKLDEIIKFAKDTKRVPPVVGDTKVPVIDNTQLVDRWNQVVEKLAGEGGIDPYVVQVALSDYVEQRGFSKPFDAEAVKPSELAKAIVQVSELQFDDIRDLIESINSYVGIVINEDMHPVLQAILNRAGLAKMVKDSKLIHPTQVDSIFDNGKKVRFQYSSSSGAGTWSAYVEGGPARWYSLASPYDINALKIILGY